MTKVKLPTNFSVVVVVDVVDVFDAVVVDVFNTVVVDVVDVDVFSVVDVVVDVDDIPLLLFLFLCVCC